VNNKEVEQAKIQKKILADILNDTIKLAQFKQSWSPIGSGPIHAARTITHLIDLYIELKIERDAMRDELEGTDPFAADPSKWGLRSQFRGACEQRDLFDEQLKKLSK